MNNIFANIGPNKRRRSLFWRQEEEQQQQEQQEQQEQEQDEEGRPQQEQGRRGGGEEEDKGEQTMTVIGNTSSSCSINAAATADHAAAVVQSPSSKDFGTPRRGRYHGRDNQQRPILRTAHDTPPSRTNPNKTMLAPPPPPQPLLSWGPKTPDVHSTKKQQQGTASTPNRYYNSPGGFALQRMLDGCMSPHVLMYQGSSAVGVTADPGPLGLLLGEDSHANASSSRGSDAASLAPPDLDDWNECFLKMPYFVANSSSSDSSSSGSSTDNSSTDGGNHYSNLLRGEVGVWDWSLKCHAKLDCFPCHCIPGTPLDGPILDYDHIEQMAMDMFRNPNQKKKKTRVQSVDKNRGEENHDLNNDDDDDDDDGSGSGSRNGNGRMSDSKCARQELVLAQWKAALMYWQYPAAHPLLMPQVTYTSNNNKVPAGVGDETTGYTSGVRRASSSNGSSVVHGSNLGGYSGGGGDSSSNGCYFTGTKFSTNGQGTSALSSSSSILMNDYNNNSTSIPAMNSFKTRKHMVNRFASGSMSSQLGGNGGDSLVGGSALLLDDIAKHSSHTTTRMVAMSQQQRKCEWQDCFRSLFIRWMRRIKELQLPELNGDGVSLSSSSSSLRCCFFSISLDRTVLFRPFYENGCIHPMIVVSSSTRQVRSCLRAMGVCMKIMYCKDSSKEEIEYKELTEEFIQGWIESKKEKKNEEDEEIKLARKELEDLRQATAQGQTVGADISISMFRRTAKRDVTSTSNCTFPPLLIVGHDDCMSFFELFTNTVGTLDVNTEEEDVFTDVPLLISRYLGPTQHMTLRQLSSTTKRGQGDQQSQQNTQTHQLSFVELNGPILPCAFQDIINASAAYFSFHKKHSDVIEKGDCSKERGNFIIDENVLGSHYFMMNLTDLGKSDIQGSMLLKGSSAVYLGTPGSFNFNGIRPVCENFSTEKDLNTGYDYGKTTTSVVWDTNRPFSIAYKCSSTKQLQN